MDIPRCTDVSRPFPTPESRACILVGQTQEVTLLKKGGFIGRKRSAAAQGRKKPHTLGDASGTASIERSISAGDDRLHPRSTPHSTDGGKPPDPRGGKANTLKQKKPLHAACSDPGFRLNHFCSGERRAHKEISAHLPCKASTSKPDESTHILRC
ncbi:Molybdenum cofactor biosynthesis enzyme [Pseudomonas syringae pv. actinidiae]|uniref:Molybdenum cofactor biosynthesis enzyme n=1 Tax=Pseudomonas syringae pv. actinidiae TaxID=103796 RepID=A0AAN4TN89_PSESF|nr:Molybdenum cofactor biosynthesis enzyme [Pseudomonas syringae pv. actinidiae]